MAEYSRTHLRVEVKRRRRRLREDYLVHEAVEDNLQFVPTGVR